MSANDLTKKEILNEPTHYFAAQEKTLDARINQIALPQEEESQILTGKAKAFVRDKVLGFFKVGEVVSEIIKWNESIDKDLREAKKEYLLAKYFEANDQNELAISHLKSFLSNPQGNTLFNKILRILDDSPPDLELAKHLSNALQYIINTDFQKLFEQHKYALSQIERMTPQALTILSDYQNWPVIELGSYSSNGTKITSDWLMEFTQAYARSKQIKEESIVNRVQHSINELISSRFIEAHLIGEKRAQCRISEVGQTILPYIKV